MKMNKEEFMLELINKLKKLPEEEKEVALTYYKEYFEEAGTENEEKVIQELGNPTEVAKQIMVEYIQKETTTEEGKNVKRSMSTVWIVCLSLLASPIALPIAVVIISLIFVAWIVIISFWIAGVSLVAGGILNIILSFFILMKDIHLAILVLGSGMLATGIGILLARSFTNLFVLYSSWITKQASKSLLRKEKKNEE